MASQSNGARSRGKQNSRTGLAGSKCGRVIVGDSHADFPPVGAVFQGDFSVANDKRAEISTSTSEVPAAAFAAGPKRVCSTVDWHPQHCAP